jgi:hypothetical protein
VTALTLTGTLLAEQGRNREINIPVGNPLVIWCEMTKGNLAAAYKSNYKMRERTALLL